MMEISDEILETIKEQSEEKKERIANIVRRMIRSMKYNGLRPGIQKTLLKIFELRICSKKFSLSIEETRRNMEWEEEIEELGSEELQPMEKFWIWYQEMIPEAMSYTEEVEEAFNKLLTLEFTSRSNMVKGYLDRIVNNIHYDQHEVREINLEGINEEIITMISASEKFKLGLKEARKRYREITEGRSNVTTSNEVSPEKVESPKKKDKGKKEGYLSCPGYNCDGYKPYGKAQSYQGEMTRELKCVKCHWKVPRGGNKMREILEEHCKKCHKIGKKMETGDTCIICEERWKKKRK